MSFKSNYQWMIDPLKPHNFSYHPSTLDHEATKNTSTITVGDALRRYAQEESVKKRGVKRERLFIRKICTYPIADIPLQKATAKDWAQWRDNRLKEVQAGTVLREFTIIKAMYRIAIHEWLWVKESPLTHIKMPKTPPSRDRRISYLEERAILEALNFQGIERPRCTKDYIALIFLFALETAMRSGEILKMRWEHVFFQQRYVHIPEAKNGCPRNVPLSKKALHILSVLPRKYATCFKISSDLRQRTFYRYVQLAGVRNLHFHDTRHEAITRLAQKLNIYDLSRMTGIKDLKILMVYYNASASEIARRLDD